MENIKRVKIPFPTYKEPWIYKWFYWREINTTITIHICTWNSSVSGNASYQPYLYGRHSLWQLTLFCRTLNINFPFNEQLSEWLKSKLMVPWNPWFLPLFICPTIMQYWLRWLFPLDCTYKFNFLNCYSVLLYEADLSTALKTQSFLLFKDKIWITSMPHLWSNAVHN